MTAPGQPIVVQREGAGETLARSFAPLQAALAQRRAFNQREQEFQLKREQFELEKLKKIKQDELTDEQILRSQVERKKNELQIDETLKEIDGRRVGQDAIGRIATAAAAQDIEFGSPEFANLLRDERAKIKDPTGFAFDEIDTFVDSLREEATSASDLAVDQASIEANEALAAQREAAADLQARQAVVNTAFQSGLSLGESAAQLDAPLALDPNIRFGSPQERAAATGRSEKQTERVLQAQTFFTEMSTSKAIIDGLLASGAVDGVNFIGQLVAANPKAKISQLLAHPALSGEQQRFIQAGWRYASAWQYFSSGQQINEGEFARLMNSTFPVFGDKDATIQQKLALQQTQIEAIKAVAAGTFNEGPATAAINGLTGLLETARTQKWEPELVQSIENQLRKAQSWQTSLQQNPNAFVLGAPALRDSTGLLLNPEEVENTRTNWSSLIRDAVLGTADTTRTRREPLRPARTGRRN